MGNESRAELLKCKKFSSFSLSTDLLHRFIINMALEGEKASQNVTNHICFKTPTDVKEKKEAAKIIASVH